MSMPGDGIAGNREKPDTPRNRSDYDAPHLSPVSAADDFRTIALNRVSGTAVLVGAAMALVTQMILNLFGVGFGFASAVNTFSGQTTAQVTTMALLWWTFSGIVAALIGGFTAGRCAGEPKEKSAGWNGLGAWAVSVLVIAATVAIAGSAMAARNNPGMTGTQAYSYNNPASSSNAMNSQNPVPFAPMNEANSAQTGTPPAASPSYATPPQTSTASNSNVLRTADAASRAALFSAIALVLGAIAAWLGGCASAVDPTVRGIDVREPGSFHSL